MADNVLGITIALRDQFTKPLHGLIQQITTVNHSLEELTKNSKIALNPTDYQKTKEEIGGIYKELPLINTSLEETTKKQNQLNKKIIEGTTPADQLAAAILNIGKAYLSIHMLHEVTELGDEFTTLRSRINIMNDGLQSTEEVTNRIKQIAVQTGTGFFHTGELVTALGIGAEESFGSTNKLLQATEKLQKMLVIDSTPLSEVNFLMTDIKHAFEEGALDAQHFRSIEMHLPSFAKILSKELNISTGELKKMVSTGQITSDVMARTLINAQGIDKQFQKMEMTFGRAMENLKTELMTGIEPAVVTITKGITSVVIKATELSTYIVTNWTLIAPIMLTIASAFTPFIVAISVATAYEKMLTLATKINMGVNIVGKGIILAKAIATSISNGATLKSIPIIIGATTAQWGFNYALMANPITWVVAGIVAFIGILGIAKYTLEHFTGVHISTIGVLKSLWSGWMTQISNQFQFLGNQILIFVDFFKNVFYHPLDAVKNLFKNTFENIYNYFGTMINDIIRGINYVIEKANKTLKTSIQIIPELQLTDKNNFESVTKNVKETYNKHNESSKKNETIPIGTNDSTKYLMDIANNTQKINEQMPEKDREKLLNLTEDKAISSFNKSVQNTKNDFNIEIESKNQILSNVDKEALAKEISEKIATDIIEQIGSYAELP